MYNALQSSDVAVETMAPRGGATDSCPPELLAYLRDARIEKKPVGTLMKHLAEKGQKLIRQFYLAALEESRLDQQVAYEEDRRRRASLLNGKERITPLYHIRIQCRQECSGWYRHFAASRIRRLKFYAVAFVKLLDHGYTHPETRWALVHTPWLLELLR